jgi:ribosomal protein S19
MRSSWKGFFVNENFLINYKQKFQPNQKKKIYHRNSTVLRHMSKTIVIIHNGFMFRQLKLTKKMHGLKFGEFSFTRKPLVVKEKTFKPIKFHQKKIRTK